MRKKVAVLFSGGKDSCLALHKAIKKGLDIKYLLNIDVENTDSYMFHKPNNSLLARQAEMLGIDLVVVKSKGVKEEELKDLKKLILAVKDKVEGIVVGGIASNYQGNRVKKICEGMGLEFIAPILNYSPKDVWKELLENGFKVIITKIACEGLDKGFLGKVIDQEMFEELRKRSEKYKFRIDFEGGEAETSVLWMPGFKKEIRLEFEVFEEGEYNSTINIKKIK